MLWAVVVQLAVAFGANLPLGAWRRGLKRLTPRWFIAIHASIPLLIAMCLLLDLPTWVIPPEVALLGLGQVVGSRLANYWR